MTKTANLAREDVQYPKILNQIVKHSVPGRTESRAFLGWFLENYYRLEEIEAQDSICDGPDDKGIDAIYVDDNLEQIDFFQSRLLQNPKKTLGDTQLKEFYGSVLQFENPDFVEEIANTTSNQELKQLIIQSKLPQKVKEGYAIRGVFLINASSDSSAKTYLRSAPQLLVYDADRLVASYVSTKPPGPISSPVTFDLYGQDTINLNVGDVEAVIAPVQASELVSLDGLASGELFVWNVRRKLGKTKVNKDIANSVKNQSEHKNFVLFHNGLTILCEDWQRDSDKLTISRYTVVNGAQSLTSVFENRQDITDELRILTRIIKLPPESDLAGRITHHSNNQNPISARDLKSSSKFQRRLQNEFNELYAGDVFYCIQRGEETSVPLMIDNSDAARIMLAYDLQQPWTCHQTYKLFDELHSAIFARPEVDAHRIYALHILYQAVMDSLIEIDNQMLGQYRLTRYFLLHLLREALDLDEVGNRFRQNPLEFLDEKKGEKRIYSCAKDVLADLIIDLNAELKEREEANNPFDYKRQFKSPNPVRELVREIIPPYLKAVRRGRASNFGEEWKNSEPK